MHVRPELQFFMFSIKLEVYLNLIVQASFITWSQFLPKLQDIPGQDTQILVKYSEKLTILLQFYPEVFLFLFFLLFCFLKEIIFCE